MAGWLQKTHGQTFELLRHFLRAFVASEQFAPPGQTPTLLIGVVPVFFQWFFLLIGPLHKKYSQLSALPDPQLFRAAARADELWLITLMMSAIGLLALARWHALFPDSLDYQTLGHLPVGAARIFAAKFAALLILCVIALAIVNFLPCAVFPALSGGRWALQPSFVARFAAHAAASLTASAFSLFALVALQGVLLNLLPQRAFTKVSGYCQAALAALLAGLLILSFSITPDLAAKAMDQPLGTWLPPVWFAGLHQALSGSTNPSDLRYARRAVLGLVATFVMSVLTYLAGYRRHQRLFIEGALTRSAESRWPSPWTSLFIRLLARSPGEQAITAFILHTASRSKQHRTVLMLYAGLAAAAVITALSTVEHTNNGTLDPLSAFVLYHLLVLVLVLIAVRHLFSLPSERPANWLFRINENDGRREWMSATERLVVFGCLVTVVGLSAPLEFSLLGIQGVADCLLFSALAVLAHEVSFLSWDKHPFTCSYRPNKLPVWLILAFFGLLGVLALAHALLVAILSNPLLLAAVLTAALAAWRRMRRLRRAQWDALHLRFEDLPHPEIEGLNLLR